MTEQTEKTKQTKKTVASTVQREFIERADNLILDSGFWILHSPVSKSRIQNQESRVKTLLNGENFLLTKRGLSVHSVISVCSVIFLWLCFFCSVIAHAQSTVTDRLLVLVNRDVLTESDVRWALALDPELQPLDLSAENRSAMLERLIDQKLLLQEAEKLPRNEPTEEEITEHLNKEIIAKFGGNEKFVERMKNVGLEQVMLREIVRRRLEILKYVDFRFRSFIFIKPEEIETYYRNTVVAEAARKGVGAPELDDKLRSDIEARLINDRVNAELDRFFDEARTQAQITRLAPIS